MEKKQRLIHVKSIDGELKQITAYVSTYQWDRMGEKFAKGAWRMDNFKKNPVVLWAHDSGMPPIGKCIAINEDDFGLLATMQFDDQDEFAMKIFSMFERGFLNAFSVGFWPNKWEMGDMEGTGEKGFIWTDAELLEFSAVPIPANPGAIVPRADADLILKIMGDKFLVKKFEGEAETFYFTVHEPEKETPAPAEPAEKTAVEKTPADTLEEFSTALKGLIDLAKVVKSQKLDEQKLALLKSSLAVLQDMALEHTEGVTRDEFLEVKEMVDKLADIFKNNHPDAQVLVSKFLMQLEVATKGYRAG